MEIGVLFLLQKMGVCSFFSKTGEAGKIMKQGLLHINPRYIQATGFNNYIYPIYGKRFSVKFKLISALILKKPIGKTL